MTSKKLESETSESEKGAGLQIFLIAALIIVPIVAAIWGVKSAPTNDRLFATILFAGFALMVSGFGYIASIPPRKSVVVVAKPIPHIGIFLVGTYVLSVLSLSLAIALTYSSPEIGMLGRLGGWAAGIGQYIFPVVTKYETQMQLSPSELFRAQSIMTAFLLPSALNGIIFTLAFLSPGPYWWEALEADPHPLSPSILVFLFPACIVFFLIVYFGAFEFSSSDYSALSGSKGCLLNALCYLRASDLTFFLTAAMESVSIAALPFICVMWLQLLLRYEQHNRSI